MTPVLTPLAPSPETQAPSQPAVPVRAPLRRWGAARPFTHRIPRRLVAASVVAHLLLLVAAISFLRIGRESAAPASAITANAGAEQLTYIDIGAAGSGVGALPAPAPVPGSGAVDTASASTPAPPVAARGAGTAAPALPGRTGGQPGQMGPAGTATGPAGSPGGTGTADGRTGGGTGGVFQPGYRDPRLYVTPKAPAPARELTEHERYMAHLEARLGTLNDSAAAEAERARKALDWTKTDKDGNRWGVSPGKVHLGKVTIPVGNSGFGNPLDSIPGPSVRKSDKQYHREEIQRQAADVERDQIAKDRIRATRERKDAERAKRRAGGG